MPVTETGTLEELCQNLAASLVNSGTDAPPLRMIGFTGAPGAGKSHAVKLMTEHLAEAKLGTFPMCAGIIPLDGFHKSNAVLQHEELSQLKGCPDSFDVVGYLMMLDRAHDGSTVVYAPGFDRQLGEPVAASHRVERQGVVFTEGNYLGSQDGPWAMIRETIDLLIYLDVPESVTHQRLLERHTARGLSPEQAASWIRRVDDPNRLLVEGSRHRADRIWALT